MANHVQWAAPAPFWTRAVTLTADARLAMRQPKILRFANDSFMEEFSRALDMDPAKLTSLEAQYETWRQPAGSAPVVAVPAKSTSRLQQKVARLKISAEHRLSMFTSGGVALAEAPTKTASDSGSQPQAPNRTLKLYQPAHQRFYLVSSALVCRIPGMPDHTLNPALQEKQSFVLRRVRTITDQTTKTTTRAEYGFIPAQGGGSWQAISTPDSALAPAEERLPLFAMNFNDDDGKKRRVFAGLIPVGRREVYVHASEQTTSPPAPPQLDEGTGNASDPGAPPPPVDPRIALLSADAIEPWKALVLRAAKTNEQATDPKNSGQPDVINGLYQASRDNLQVGSWYVLLDFATFLDTQLNDAWLAIQNGTTPSDQPTADVVNAIRSVARPSISSFGLKTPSTLADALVAVVAFRDDLEKADGSFTFTPSVPGSIVGWPDFSFPLADAQVAGGVPDIALPPGPSLTPTQIVLRKISALRDLIAAALPKTPTAPVPDLPLAAMPVMAPNEPAHFIVRCVLDRAECVNEPVVLSPASREFELAAFFDTDAPARPIRISLPIDTSPAGLRRAPKNTAFMVSDMLCGQINRAKGLGLVDLVMSVLPFPLHKDLSADGPKACTTDTDLSLGMICSLSIPIITICALIVLMIMISLFDIIFRWLPFFIFCFPLPKFSSKPSQT